MTNINGQIICIYKQSGIQIKESVDKLQIGSLKYKSRGFKLKYNLNTNKKYSHFNPHFASYTQFTSDTMSEKNIFYRIRFKD